MSPTSPSENHGPGAKLPDRTGLTGGLRREVTAFAKRIRVEHGPLERDVADRLGRLLRSSVAKRRKPGRKTSPEVLEAVELRGRGLSWSRIYGEVFPGYWSLDLAHRHYLSHKLRDAVRSHLRRRGRKGHANRPPEIDA
jgi:hypothetical protein